MTNVPKIISENRLEILSRASKHGVKNVRLFGSVARGEARPESDIDILVDMEPGRSLFDLVVFGQEMEELLKRKVDVVTERGISPYLRKKILAEAAFL